MALRPSGLTGRKSAYVPHRLYPKRTSFVPTLTSFKGEHYCGDGDCTIGQGEAWSWSVGFSASAPIYRWITGGFSVSMGHEKTEYVECSAGAGESVCIWFGKWNTEYTVQNIEYPMDPRCGGIIRGSTARVTSPQSGSEGSISWCGRKEQCDTFSEWDIDWYGS
jgi:hypothetical protein